MLAAWLEEAHKHRDREEHVHSRTKLLTQSMRREARARLRATPGAEPLFKDLEPALMPEEFETEEEPLKQC